jgi:hypothetical protein
LTAAVLGASPAPPTFVGKAQIAVTLGVREHGKLVRTVRFHWTNPVTAADVRAWRGSSGFWVVTLLGHGAVASLALCGPSFCGDAEPGHEDFGAPFNNLTATTTGLASAPRRIVLTGHVDVIGRGAVTNVSGDDWFTANEARGFAYDAPAPVTVAPGQQLFFTIVLKVPFGPG